MPKLKKAPAFQWYARDYLSDAVVISMTLEQEGAYNRLMNICWLEKGLPSELDELWKLSKANSRDHFTRRIWNVVGKKFQLRRCKFQHKRLDLERAKQAKNRRKKQLAANKRWEEERCKRNARALQNGCPTSASTSTTAVSTKIKSTVAARRPVENRREPEHGTFGLYCTIAQEARRDSNSQDGSDSIANIAAIFKALCAKRDISYDGEIAAKAIAVVVESA